MFKNNDVIICPNVIKMKILRQLRQDKKLIQLKFYTLDQFKKSCFGSYNEETIYYMMKTYGYRYDVAKTHLENSYGNDLLIQELKNNNVWFQLPFNVSRIVIMGYLKVDSYVMDEIQKYDYIVIEETNEMYQPTVYELETIEDEVNFILEQIVKLLKEVEIDKICLVNVGKEYKNVVNRMFNLYHIPINLSSQKSIYGTNTVKRFLNHLKKDKKIVLEDDCISHKIVEIVNKYQFTQLDDIVIECIENELKNTTIEIEKMKAAVNVVSVSEMVEDKYYFILGFNEGTLPHIYKDEDFLSDAEKKALGIMTSYEKNEIERISLSSILQRYEHMIITYKNSNQNRKCYPSSLLDELGLKIEKGQLKTYSSNQYNQLLLSKKIDRFVKYNESDQELSYLFSNYQNLPYATYQNQFTGINQQLFYEYINKKLVLSYSSLDTYNRCGFRYYIKNILKLDTYTETFMIFIGNLFHYLLAVSRNKDFDFETEFSNFIMDKSFSYKEQFFLEKLKKDILFTIETIQQFDEYSELKDVLLEEKIYINKDQDLYITFMGVIDKIQYKQEEDKTYIAVIDYKTGNTSVNMDNIPYGIDMQLPIYLYLVKQTHFQNIQPIGFYLQKIVHNKLPFKANKDYQEELKNLYRLEGYSINNEEKLKLFDKEYMNSRMIKGMKVSSKGFYAYTKTLSEQDMDDLINLVDQKINETIEHIKTANFTINPKKIGDKLVGCEYCTYRDLCFMTEKDIVKLEQRKFESR